METVEGKMALGMRMCQQIWRTLPHSKLLGQMSHVFLVLYKKPQNCMSHKDTTISILKRNAEWPASPEPFSSLKTRNGPPFFQFGRIHVQRRCLHLRIHPVLSQTSWACSSKLLSKAFLILQLFVKKPVVFGTYSLD